MISDSRVTTRAGRIEEAVKLEVVLYHFRMKWRLVTFGGGDQRYMKAAERLARESRIPEIAEVCIESQHSLETNHQAFWHRHSDFFAKNPRLFGYAIWKPYIIGAHLDALPAGWGLIYLDAGCVVNSAAIARERLTQYQRHAEQHGIWATCLDRGRWGSDQFPERAWTKEDLLAHVGATEGLRNSAQWQSGMILLTPTARVRGLVEEWEHLSVMRDYHFSSDAPSVSENHPSFVEHRHDQSIFSVLAKSRGFEAVSDETWFAPKWFRDGKEYPIWAARWRRGTGMTAWHPAYAVRSFRQSREG